MAIIHRRGWAARAYQESPWYFPIRPFWERFAEHSAFPSPSELHAVYRMHVAQEVDVPSEALALCFVEAPKKPRRKRNTAIALRDLYEGRIVEQHEVPTRLDDWHDFFNVLSFTAFPRAKWALHRRQYQALQARIGSGAARLPGARTREQDALTLFDEGGIVLLLSPEQIRSLAESSLDVTHQLERWCLEGKALAVPFGHALYEHLVEGLPCPLGTVHIVRTAAEAPVARAQLSQLDRALARDLADPELFTVPSALRGLSLAQSVMSPIASS